MRENNWWLYQKNVTTITLVGNIDNDTKSPTDNFLGRIISTGYFVNERTIKSIIRALLNLCIWKKVLNETSLVKSLG